MPSDSQFAEAPKLSGGVDLGHPVQQAGRAFLTALAQRGAKCAVFLGIDSRGEIIATAYTPGGLTELFGTAMVGMFSIAMQQWLPPRGTNADPNVQPEPQQEG